MSKRITITERRLRAVWGYCYPATGEVVLASGLTERQRLETLVHELLHVALPETAEEEVERMGAFLGRHLWRQGYRRRTEKQ